MADDRTEEQRAADEALDAAVRATATAYGESDGSSSHLVTEWMVTAIGIPADPDSDDDDRTYTFAPEGGRRTHRSALLGMLWSGQLAILDGEDL